MRKNQYPGLTIGQRIEAHLGRNEDQSAQQIADALEVGVDYVRQQLSNMQLEGIAVSNRPGQILIWNISTRTQRHWVYSGKWPSTHPVIYPGVLNS